MVNAILTQLDQGHWDVLTAGFAQIHFEGYPHPAAMQWRTHQDMGTLTQSLRYTGKQFMDESLTLDQLFYVANKPSIYDDYFRDALNMYRRLINSGVKMEVARDLLPSCYRQGWSCAGNLKDWLHLLDRRLLADTQKEANHAAWAAVDVLTTWCPEIMNWYVAKRAGKNKLSP
jgi:flavin-dependent thymidylate synthase